MESCSNSKNPYLLPIGLAPWATHKINKLIDYKDFYFKMDTPEKINNFILDVVLHSFYSKQYHDNPPLVEKHEIVVAADVMMDGLGDYYNALTVAEIIKELFPDQKILMVVDMDEQRYDFVRKNQEIECYRAQYPEPKNISERVKNASLILEVSQPIQLKLYTGFICNAIKQKKETESYQRLLEYGCRYEMGLDYLSWGIFNKEMPADLSMMDLGNEDLKKIFFKTVSPDHENIEKYFQENELFFSYMHEPKSLLLYAYAAIASQQMKDKNIDIVTPLKSNTKMDLSFLKELGIGKIEFYSMDSSKVTENLVIAGEKQISQEGKTLRMINLFPLVHKDMLILIQQSHPFAGGTGNQSFSEMKNKVIFYQLNFYTQVFFNTYRFVAASELGSEEKVFVKYLDACDKGQSRIDFASLAEMRKRALNIAKFVDTPELIEEAQQLSQILQEKFSVTDRIRGMIARHRFHQVFPELIPVEKELRSAFQSGTMNLQEIWGRLEAKMKEFTHSLKQGLE